VKINIHGMMWFSPSGSAGTLVFLVPSFHTLGPRGKFFAQLQTRLRLVEGEEIELFDQYIVTFQK